MSARRAVAAVLRRLRRRGDAGVSVVELGVTAAVGSVVLVAVATVAVGAMSAVRDISARSATSGDVRVVQEAVTRDLRVAVRPSGETAAIVSGTATAVSFYALLNRSGTAQTTDTVPSLVELGWNGTCITRRITAGAAVADPDDDGPFYTWTPTGTATCLARTTTAPAYAYYATGLITSGGSTVAPIALSGGALAAADLRTVQSVQATLTVVDPRNPGAGGSTVVSRVTLTNVLTDTGGT